jgi:hypothetical protein
MTERDTGGPAFPQVELDRLTGNPCDQYLGMTLRDYFAAKVIDGLLDHCPTYTVAAEEAYKLADAMLKARSA